MKRKLLVLNAVALATALTGLQSCKKTDYTNTSQVATLGTASISGKVYARLVDTVGAPSVQFAPTSVVISAWIDTKDQLYYTDSIAQYAKKYYTVSVDGNGKYNLTVDISKYKMATVHIEPVKFTYNQVIKSTVAPFNTTTVSKTYEAVPNTVMVDTSSKITADVYYTIK